MEPECSLRCTQQSVIFLHPQTKPAHANPFDFFKFYFNVILSFTCMLSKRSVFFRFPAKNMYTFVSSLQACPPTWRACHEAHHYAVHIRQRTTKWLLCQKKDQFADRHGCFGHLHPASYIYVGKPPLAPYVSRPNKICLPYLKCCQ